AAALPGLAGLQVDPGRAQHARQVDAVVVGEVAVLDRLQAGDQQLGHVLDPHQLALLLRLAVERGDARRVQAHRLGRLAAAGVAQAGDAAARQPHLDPARRDVAADVAEAATGDHPVRALVAVGPGALAAVLAVRGRGQLRLQGLRVHRHAGRQQQRARVHAGGHLPAQLAEALGHLLVEVDGVRDQEAEPEADRRQRPGQQPPAPVRPVSAVDLVLVFVVIDAGHGTVRERQCDNGAGAGEAASLAQPALNARWHARCGKTGRWRKIPRRTAARGRTAPSTVSWSYELSISLADARFWFDRATGLVRRGWISLRTRGLRASWQRVRAQLRRVPAAQRAALAFPPGTPRVPAALATSDAPLASIVIPVHGQLDHTLLCLRALAAWPPRAPFEVILVDDGSPDDSGAVLPAIEGLRYLRREQNGGFIAACNDGAALARGEYLVFLNNDTVPQPGWLDALLETFAGHPGAGLVGAQLLYPDGRLQEAGGVVFDDGSGWNYGRHQSPADPRYAYLREADYASGAAIAIPRALFAKVGGFDARYAP